MNTIDWLMEGDPAIRWQVMRDLLEVSDEEIAEERAKVATAGWGARLLSLQQPDGGWGTPNPRRYIDSPEGSAVHALSLLRYMGVDPGSHLARIAVDKVSTLTHYEGGQRFFSGEVEACINARVLLAAIYFDRPQAGLVERLLDDQLADGGWNCYAPPSTRSSFHSTINVLEALSEHERANGVDVAVTDARARGETYLLERRLLRSLSTGEVINPRWTLLSFPPGYRYDILRGLDYFRVADVRPDDRMDEALDLVEGHRDTQGRWPLQNPDSESPPLDMGEIEGEPSRWNTLRALRVMRWAGR